MSVLCGTKPPKSVEQLWMFMGSQAFRPGVEGADVALPMGHMMKKDWQMPRAVHITI